HRQEGGEPGHHHPPHDRAEYHEAEELLAVGERIGAGIDERDLHQELGDGTGDSGVLDHRPEDDDPEDHRHRGDAEQDRRHLQNGPGIDLSDDAPYAPDSCHRNPSWQCMGKASTRPTTARGTGFPRGYSPLSPFPITVNAASDPSPTLITLTPVESRF